MIRSMTGFASAAREDESAAVGVTIRAVNHRYLDLQLRLPPGLAPIEGRLRAAVQRQVARGRVELSVSVQLRQAPPPEVELNEPFVRRLTGALERAREEGLVDGALTPGDLLRLPQALVIREAAKEDVEGVDAGTLAEAAVEEALAALNEMRAREGSHLQDDLEARRALLADQSGWHGTHAAAARQHRRDAGRRLRVPRSTLAGRPHHRAHRHGAARTDGRVGHRLLRRSSVAGAS